MTDYRQLPPHSQQSQINESMFRWIVGGLSLAIAGLIMYQLNTAQSKIDTLVNAIADMRADVKVLATEQSASAKSIAELQGKLEVLGNRRSK